MFAFLRKIFNHKKSTNREQYKFIRNFLSVNPKESSICVHNKNQYTIFLIIFNVDNVSFAIHYCKLSLRYDLLIKSHGELIYFGSDRDSINLICKHFKIKEKLADLEKTFTNEQLAENVKKEYLNYYEF